MAVQFSLFAPPVLSHLVLTRGSGLLREDRHGTIWTYFHPADCLPDAPRITLSIWHDTLEVEINVLTGTEGYPGGMVLASAAHAVPDPSSVRATIWRLASIHLTSPRPGVGSPERIVAGLLATAGFLPEWETYFTPTWARPATRPGYSWLIQATPDVVALPVPGEGVQIFAQYVDLTDPEISIRLTLQHDTSGGQFWIDKESLEEAIACIDSPVFPFPDQSDDRAVRDEDLGSHRPPANPCAP